MRGHIAAAVGRLPFALRAAISASVVLAVALSIVLSSCAPASQPAPILPPSGSLDATAFKGLGDLAFVWDGLLYALDGETGRLTQLTKSGTALAPAWSSNGRWVAYLDITREGATTGRLSLVRRDGSGTRQVEGLPDDVSSQDFQWSPTSSTVAVGNPAGLWLVTSDGDAKKIDKGPGPYWFAWSPDGTRLAYNRTLPSENPENRDDAIYVLDVSGEAGDSEQALRVTIVERAGAKIAGWSTDGKQVLYWVDPLHSASLAADGMALMSIPAIGGNPRQMADSLGYRDWLSFGPKNLLVAVTGNGREAWSNKGLTVIDLESGTGEDIPRLEGRVSIDPALSPDGTLIAYVSAKDLGASAPFPGGGPSPVGWPATRELRVVDTEGRSGRVLAEAGAGVFRPAWSQDGSRIVFVRDNSVWVIGTDGNHLRKVLGPFPGRRELSGYYGFARYWGWEIAWHR